MKISYLWLKDYLGFDLTPEQVAEKLTQTGLEVEATHAFENIRGGLDGVVIGKVISVKQHPNADRLRLAQTDVGNGNILPIVCGAPNVAEGQTVVVALPGATLYPTSGDPFTIKSSKIRGEVSEGMICAEDELGLGNSHEGIITLSEPVSPGTPASDYFKVWKDFTFEIGLTPNRTDAMSHLGVARDLMAKLNIDRDKPLNLQIPDTSAFQQGANENIKVEIHNPEACPRYMGLSITNIKVGPSPDWLKNRLLSIGIRPINNVVDVTNFVLHETGQPLHAFDQNKIEDNTVVVRLALPGESFTTLDETERKLKSRDLMICDRKKPMCIAGVFGGLHSGVTDNTTTIFLESACFSPAFIRKTSSNHQLKTDAASRFEKGTDPELTDYAIKRAALLLCEITGGQIASRLSDNYPGFYPKTEVSLRFSKLEQIGGVTISPNVVKKILQDLDFEIRNENNETLQLTVPRNRVDVTREIDVIEEVLRIYGYDSIPLPGKLAISLNFSPEETITGFRNKVAGFLSDQGFCEMLVNPLTQSSFYTGQNRESIVPILKSINNELDILRPDVLRSGLEAIRHNWNRGNQQIRLFEIGNSYHRNSNKYTEEEHIALFICGEDKPPFWQEKSNPSDFFLLRGMVESVLEKFGNIGQLQTKTLTGGDFDFALEYVSQAGKTVVRLGRVSQELTKKHEIKPEVWFADFDFELLFKTYSSRKTKFQELPKFPGTRRDLALLLDRNIAFAELEKLAWQCGKGLLKEVALFDVFEDESKLGTGKKSYALSFYFRDDRQTITDKQVEKVMEQIAEKIKSGLNATIR